MKRYTTLYKKIVQFFIDRKIFTIYVTGLAIAILAIGFNTLSAFYNMPRIEDPLMCLVDPQRACFHSHVIVLCACMFFAYMMARMCKRNDAQKTLFELDIEQQKKDKIALQKIKRDLEEKVIQEESLWKNSKDFLVLYAMDGRVLRASESAYDAFNVPRHLREQLLIFDFFNEPELAVMKSRLERMMQGEDVEDTVYHIRKWGEKQCEIPVEVSVTTSFFKGEKCALVVARPIEERVRLQEEQSKNERIEAVSALSAGIAHDFNNLLCAIGGNAQLLELNLSSSCEVGADDKCINYLRQITTAVGAATNLTRQLSMLAKGGSQEWKTVNLAHMLKNVGEISIGHGSRCRLKTIIPNDLKPVLAIEGQIDQVVQNILINARHAMPDGGVIELGARNVVILDDNRYHLASGQYVEIWVKDQGTGIDAEHLPRIFDPYFSTKENGKGTGLGLTSASRAIEHHGGDIVVDSRPGEGTQFTFCLPVAKINAEVLSGCTDIVSKMPQKIMKILVMDDELALRELMKKMLLRFGHTVAVVANGEEVIVLYQEHQEKGEPFDLVILDQTIPGGMGGMETINALKRIDPAVRSIGYSGYTDDVPEGIYDAFLAKPIQMNELERLIQKIGKSS
jgi:signal transduction histidine kinase/ActR/RegA family two-component response regulator